MICLQEILLVTAGASLFLMGFLSGWRSGRGMW